MSEYSFMQAWIKAFYIVRFLDDLNLSILYVWSDPKTSNYVRPFEVISDWFCTQAQAEDALKNLTAVA